MLFDTSSHALLDLPGLTFTPQAVWSPFKGLEGTIFVFPSQFRARVGDPEQVRVVRVENLFRGE